MDTKRLYRRLVDVLWARHRADKARRMRLRKRWREVLRRRGATFE